MHQKYQMKHLKVKQDVDLGYTDVTGGKTAKELLKESKESDQKKKLRSEPKNKKKKNLMKILV